MKPASTIARAAGALSLSAVLLLAACATPASTADSADEATTVSVKHAQGTTEVTLNPSKVVTFDYASLDTLDALGVDVMGVPQDNLPGYLSEYASDDYTNIGTLFEPDYEAVNAAAPDLIIVANRSAAAYDELSKIAPTIDLTLDWEDYVASFESNTEILGEVFDQQDEVATALAEIEDKIAATKKATADAGSGLIVLTSAGEISAYGSDSRFGWLHSVLGVTPAVVDVEAATHGDPISNEFILEANPDWLFVIDRDSAIGESGDSAEQVLDNEVVAGTTAWTKDQVIYLDGTAWYIVMSGLTAMNTKIDQIADGI